jgi:hypothetical protein
VTKLAKDNDVPFDQLHVPDEPERPVRQQSRADGSKRRRLEDTDGDVGMASPDQDEVEDQDESDVSPDEDETNTALSLRHDRKRRKQRTELVLSGSLLGITDDVSPSTMKERRDEFHRYLGRVEVKQVINKTTVVEGFTPEQAVELTNFFFDQVMGPSGLSHVAGLISYYTTHQPGEPDQGLAGRASELAAGDDKPLAVRQFFGTVSRQQALAQSNSTLFKMLQQNVVNLQVLGLLNDLKERVNKKDTELCNYLRRMKEKPGRGKGWTSCLINHLTSTLGISNNAFSSLTAVAQGAQCLVSELCEGVLCLLPKGGAAKWVTPDHHLARSCSYLAGCTGLGYRKCGTFSRNLSPLSPSSPWCRRYWARICFSL